MRLDASLEVTARDVRVDLEVPAGKTVAIVGENGSGKSTVLQVLAGLLRADVGRALLGDHVLFDARTTLSAHKRHVALLAQDPRLFPRMTARRNVEFSLRARGAPRSQASTWLRLMAAEDLADRRPGQLSGGQQQRVAIARALAAEPDLLLMDEPMAALDAPIAADLRHRLREVLAQRTALIVTHEILDAALLADEVVVMQGGRVVEAGQTSVLMRNPRTAFAANLCGLNLIGGRARTQTSLDSDHGLLCGLGTLQVGCEAFAAFPPAAVAVYRQRPHGSPRNVVAAHVRTLTPHGQVVRVDTSAFAADLTPGAVSELALAPGMDVSLVVKANEVRLYSR